jgi:hypothetical protein
MTLIAMLISIVAATGSLTAAYWIAGQSSAANALLVIGILWLLGEWKRVRWITSLALLAFVSAAAAGLWIGMPPSLMVVGAVAALLGWDLSSFARRLSRAARTDDVHGLEMRHLARAAIVAALALVIAGIASFVRLHIPFELAVVLVLLGTIGLTRLVFWIQRENDL